MKSPIFSCRNCGARFAEPSFSEGPKTVDSETGEVVRFRQARSLCPACLSDRINVPEELRGARR
jgi:ribosomal protein L37AE/L43A